LIAARDEILAELLSGAVIRGLELEWAVEFTAERDSPNSELRLTAPPVPRLTDPVATAPGRPVAWFKRVTPPEVVTPAPKRVLAAM
jgi:hypothetical protein